MRDEFGISHAQPKLYLQREHGINISVDAGKSHSILRNRIIQSIWQGNALIADGAVIGLAHAGFRLTSRMAILVE